MTASLIRHTRAGGSSFVGMLLLTACSAALSAPVCGPGEICLDFNDNLMPSGWGVYFNANGPGRNVQIANGRLEVGQVDTYGGIYKPLDMTGVTKLSVEYDGNIAPVYWGQATATMLLQSVTNGAANFGAGYVMTTGAKNGFGTNAMNFGLSYQPTPANGGAVVATSSGNLAPQYGTFHFASTFQDGFASLRVTDSAGAQVWSTNGNVALPGFTLASMPNLGLFGVTTTGASAWIDNVKIGGLAAPNPPAPPPTDAALAILAQAVYEPKGFINIGKYGILKQWADNGDGFKATAYLDKSSNQVVIAVRGTSLDSSGKAAFYNLLADGGLQPHALDDKWLHQYAVDLANFVKETHDVMPAGATLTLTGHSMGGVLVEMLGKAVGIATTGFDAPGSLDVYEAFKAELTPSIALLKGLNIQSSGPATITNVRLQGDQVSMIGYQDAAHTGQVADKIITVLNNFDVKEPTGKVLDIKSDVLKFHSIDTLAQLLNASGNVATRPGFSTDTDVLPKIIRGIQASCAQAIPGASCLAIKTLAGLGLSVFDPSPGNDYYLLADPGSPFITFLELPVLDGVAGWKVRFRDQFGWSDFTSEMGFLDYLFDFTTDVTGVEFIPLNSLGEQGYANDYFLYTLRFASAGEFSATQIEISAVPEPATLALVLAAIGGLGFARRSSMRRHRTQLTH